MNSYLYFIDDSYIVFDCESMAFYLIPTDIGEELIKMDEIDRNAMLERVLASKRTVACAQTENEHRPLKCSRLILVLAQTCNLACRYCYADEGTYGVHGDSMMTFETARNAIDKMHMLFPDGIGLIQFFGGEPLLNYPVIEQVCDYCTAAYQSGNIKVLPDFAIVTNGTVMNNDIVRILNKYHINVTVSLDGPKDVNDSQRIYRNGRHSVFNRVMESINVLNNCRTFALSVEVTLTQKFIELSEFEKNQFMDFLVSKKIDSIHTVPVIDVIGSDMRIRDDAGLANCIDFITDYTLRTLQTNNPIFLFKSADFISVIMSKTKKRHFCSAGISNFAIDTQGDVYGCFMLINPDKDMCMGNVNELNIEWEHWNQISAKFDCATYDSNLECKECCLNGFCSNCIAASYSQFGVLNHPIHESCVAQKTMFERIGYHLARNNKIVK